MFGGCTPNSKELLHSATVPTRTQVAKGAKKSQFPFLLPLVLTHLHAVLCVSASLREMVWMLPFTVNPASTNEMLFLSAPLLEEI